MLLALYGRLYCFILSTGASNRTIHSGIEGLIEGPERQPLDLDMTNGTLSNLLSLGEPRQAIPPKFYRSREASKYLKEVHGVDRSPSTLAKYRCVGGGPVYRKIGRIPHYAAPDLDDYVRSLLGPVQRSSSDIGGAA
jgi:hypothetical protein